MSNFRTKYLKIACNLLWAVFLLIFVFAFLPKLLIYFMPFVVGMIFAMIANPMVKFLEKRIKINRKYGSVIMIVLVIGLVVLVCYGAGAVLAKGIGAFMAYLPTMSANAGTEFSEAINQLQQLLEKLPFTQNVLRFCNAWGNRRICQKPAGYDRWHSRRTACSIFFYCR